MFLTPEYTIEASDYLQRRTAAIKLTRPATVIGCDRYLQTGGSYPVTDQHCWPTCSRRNVQFLGDDNFLGNTIVLGGTAGNDKLIAGAADDDTVWGDGGNDYHRWRRRQRLPVRRHRQRHRSSAARATTPCTATRATTPSIGGDGIDNIFGGDGNDYIEGGRGDDIIMGGLGNDIIIGNEGADELTGGEGDDWLESRGGQGELMFGDFGAPTGGLPLYSGNDVMIGGVAGGDIMKGFSGDDIMVGGGSFTKFIGGLGFDWGSYENATHGVSEDMNRKEFISPNGSEDSIRDIWQHTEGASGSPFDDIIIGANDTRLLATKDELDNVNLITGLAGFFAPGSGVVRRRQHHPGRRRQRRHQGRRRRRHHRRRRLPARGADQLQRPAARSSGRSIRPERQRHGLRVDANGNLVVGPCQRRQRRHGGLQRRVRQLQHRLVRPVIGGPTSARPGRAKASSPSSTPVAAAPWSAAIRRGWPGWMTAPTASATSSGCSSADITVVDRLARATS